MSLTVDNTHTGLALAASGAIELVEDDDVVFTLGVCREVNRIYQDYQEGQLRADDSLMSGMYVTLDMLGGLGEKVTAGMPAMRVAVATAQANEIIAVLYGQQAVVALDPAADVRMLRRHRSVVAASVGEGAPGDGTVDPQGGYVGHYAAGEEEDGPASEEFAGMLELTAGDYTDDREADHHPGVFERIRHFLTGRRRPDPEAQDGEEDEVAADY